MSALKQLTIKKGFSILRNTKSRAGIIAAFISKPLVNASKKTNLYSNVSEYHQIVFSTLPQCL